MGIKRKFPRRNKEYTQYSQLLQSYLLDGFLRIKQKDAFSELKEIKVGVPQGISALLVIYQWYPGP